MERGNISYSKYLFAFALASLLASTLMQRYMGHASSGADVDFYDYYFAAQVIHDNPHADLYEGATSGNPQLRSSPVNSALAVHARAAGFSDIELYLYPPLLADLLAPFSQLSPHLAAVLWRAFNLSLVLVSVLLLAHMLRTPILSYPFATLLFAAYCFWPIHEAIAQGQIAIVMLALWALGIAAYYDNRVVLSAAAFAFATVFKVTPILLLPLFFLWKDRRWIVSYFTVLLALAVSMLAFNGLPTVSVYAKVMSGMGGGLPALQNKSISSLVSWLYFGKIFTLDSAHVIMADPPHFLSAISKAASGLFYLACLFFAWRNCRRFDRVAKARVVAVFGLAIACISPVSWRHGYCVALLALAILWAEALRTTPRIYHLALLTLTTFTIGSLFFDLAAGASLPHFLQTIFAASWIVFSVLLCIDALIYAAPDAQTEPCKAGC